jgi:hypothetical protein
MNKRRRFGPVFVPFLFGVMALMRVTTGPRFATYYKPDMLALFAAGMCFGAAIALLVAWRRDSRRL